MKVVRAGALLISCTLSFLLTSASHAAPAFIDARFSLTRLDGRTATQADFRGKWLIVYFGYTFCPDVCPTTLAAVENALDRLGPRAKEVQPIFVTLDPARDSAPVLGAYLKSFPHFAGLRGNASEIAEAAARFHVYYRLRGLGNGEYTVDHSSFLYVVDPRGHFVELLSGDVPGHRLDEALRKLVS